ncbi:unnamed protein product, partial [marine sediment metagenome]
VNPNTSSTSDTFILSYPRKNATRDCFIKYPKANSETVIHEVIHANFGFGEEVTQPLAKIMDLKQRMMARFPLVKGLLTRGINYQKCGSCEEFNALHTKYGERTEHYVRQ